MSTTGSQKGFAALELVLGLMVLASIVFAGWVAYQAHENNVTNASKVVTNADNSKSAHSDTQTADQDVLDKTNLRALQTQLEAYYASNGVYPSQANFYSASWRSQNMMSLDPTAVTTASGKQIGQPGGFSYAPTSCDASGCQHYSLSATLSGGTVDTIKDLGQ